ncbi:MAG: T9SS type A sorting domain-containing protein [Bacteroidota bacterium]
MKTNLLTLLICLSFLPPIMGQNPDWIVFNTSNSGLGDNDVRSLSIDNNGVKWVGTVNDAVFTWDGEVWNHYNSANSYVFDDYILCISTDVQNNKWIGSRSGGLAEFDETQWYFWDETHSEIPDDKVYDVQFEGTLKWVATMHGLASFDGSVWTTWNTSNSQIPAEEIRAIAIDGSGNKWIATWGGGLAKFDGTTWTIFDKSNSPIPDDYCISLFYDGAFFWIGTSGNGLVKFDGADWTVYTITNSGIPSDFVFNTKAEGSKRWFATGAGLALLEGADWTVFNPSNSGLPGQIVKDIEIDASGNKWIATDQGLAEFRQGGVLRVNNQIADQGRTADITVSPNPVKTGTTISWQNHAGSEAHFWLINPTGQIIPLEINPVESPGMASHTIDLSNQPRGIYLLNGLINNRLVTKKIILN